jgi:sugar phosphate isomerase/epimerase
MRLGAQLKRTYRNPDQWIAILREKGYRAAYCPVQADADDAEIAAYAQAADAADIVIAEVGAWGNNPLSPDPGVRRASIARCQELLDLADRVGARCCVNVAGSRGARWAGPDDDNLTPETFDLIVEVTREIIDGVQPTRAVWALEDMPWIYPNSVESYVRLVAAIDRDAFGVHFDPVNIVNSPHRYDHNGDLIRDFVAQLGDRIVSCHAKDIVLRDALTLHLDETRPGTGNLDYVAYLRALATLDPDLPLMIEHLPSEAEYDQAAAYIRGVAARMGIEM